MNTAALTDIKLQITGMTCASRVMRVEKSLQSVPVVRQASINLATEQASVSAEPAVTADTLAAAVRKAGYDVATTETTLLIEGMTFASCVARVEKALLKVPGVSGATVNFATEKASIQALSTVPVAALKAAIGWPSVTRSSRLQRWSVATETAGITLMRGEPWLVADSLDESRRTYSKVKQGLFWAFGYSVMGIPLAALGLLNPVIAGAAMAFSSVSVVLNALTLRRWQGVADGHAVKSTKQLPRSRAVLGAQR